MAGQGVQNFDISYSQSDIPGVPGEITVNGETLTADGRLDTVGDSVFADGFTGLTDYSLAVECVRTSATTMEVRVILTAYVDDSSYYCNVIEKVIPNVPLSPA